MTSTYTFLTPKYSWNHNVNILINDFYFTDFISGLSSHSVITSEVGRQSAHLTTTLVQLANITWPMMCKLQQYSQVTWLVVTEVRSESFGLVTERHHYKACPIYGYCSSHVCTVRPVVFFIVKCGYCVLSLHMYAPAMHVFDIRASSSPRRLPLCQISFPLWPPC